MKFLALLTIALTSLVSVEATSLGLFAGLFSGHQKCNFYAVAPSCSDIHNKPFYYDSDGCLYVGKGKGKLCGYYDNYGSISFGYTSIWDFIWGVKGLIIKNGKFLFAKTGSFCNWKLNGSKYVVIDNKQNCYACQENGGYKVYWGTNYQCQKPFPITVHAKNC